jgi:hypothetical protein
MEAQSLLRFTSTGHRQRDRAWRCGQSPGDQTTTAVESHDNGETMHIILAGVLAGGAVLLVWLLDVFHESESKPVRRVVRK